MIERDYLEWTIATVRQHQGADNCWPQWANIFADEIERLWRIEVLARQTLAPFSGTYSCGCCPHGTSFLIPDYECDCGCHVTARNIVALKDALGEPARTITFNGGFELAWLGDGERVQSAGDGTGACEIVSADGSVRRVEVGDQIEVGS